jgi:hypothetical protein
MIESDKKEAKKQTFTYVLIEILLAVIILSPLNEYRIPVALWIPMITDGILFCIFAYWYRGSSVFPDVFYVQIFSFNSPFTNNPSRIKISKIVHLAVGILLIFLGFIVLVFPMLKGF